jgi:hypothetical protein
MPDVWDERYDAQSGDETLDLLMALAFAAGAAVARTEELRVPALVCLTEDGTLQSHHLVTDAVPVSTIVHVTLHAARATHAALCIESWQVDLLATAQMQADAEAGRPVRPPPDVLRPSQHPDRYGVLVLIGEARGQPQVMRRWRLVARTDGTRELVPIPEPKLSHATHASLNPLFRDHAEIRRLLRASAELQRLFDQSRARRN